MDTDTGGTGDTHGVTLMGSDTHGDRVGGQQPEFDVASLAIGPRNPNPGNAAYG